MPMTPMQGRIPEFRFMVPGLAERVLSSPFIRWLLENQEIVNDAGVAGLLALLQAMPLVRPAGLVGPAGSGMVDPALLIMALAGPGLSSEQASAQDFRDLPAMRRIALTRAGQSPSWLAPRPDTMPGRQV
jgi:hypothetical protein